MIVSSIKQVRSTSIAVSSRIYLLNLRLIGKGVYGKGKTDVFICGVIKNKVSLEHTVKVNLSTWARSNLSLNYLKR